MNREIGRLSPTTSPADKERRRSESSGKTAVPDDEFDDFFDKGDIGDYEGGVACSQPPSKLAAEVSPVEALRRPDFSQQRARRAFFARVVGVVVTGCVLLLVTAARFKPHANAMAAGAGDHESVLHQPASPAAAPPEIATPVVATAVPAPLAPQLKQVDAEPKHVEDSVAIAPRPEVAVSAEPARLAAPAPPASPLAKVEKSTSVAAKPKKVSLPAAQPMAAARSVKVASKKGSKTSETALPEVKQPVVATPVVPKQSFAAFPVD